MRRPCCTEVVQAYRDPPKTCVTKRACSAFAQAQILLRKVSLPHAHGHDSASAPCKWLLPSCPACQHQEDNPHASAAQSAGWTLDAWEAAGHTHTCLCLASAVTLGHAGKSTLLDLIAGRKTIGELHGDILFSGIRPTQAFLRRYTGAPPAAPAPRCCLSTLPAKGECGNVLFRTWH